MRSRLAQVVMSRARRFVVNLVWALAEIEVLFSQPNDPLAIRRLYLRLQRIRFSKVLWIGRDFYLQTSGNLTIGDRCALGEHTMILNWGTVTIGDDFLSAPGLHLNTGTHDVETLEPGAAPIRIGSRVWCGANVTVLAGVSIGDDTVIGAGAVVCADLPPRSVAVGVPARVVRTLARPEGCRLWTWVDN